MPYVFLVVVMGLGLVLPHLLVRLVPALRGTWLPASLASVAALMAVCAAILWLLPGAGALDPGLPFVTRLQAFALPGLGGLVVSLVMLQVRGAKD